MNKPQRLNTTFLNNLKPNPKTTKFADYEVNLSAMKDSGLSIGVCCLVGKGRGSGHFEENSERIPSANPRKY
ncbi:TPA: hypothetical protein ACPJ06_003761 [Vibrio diabolicus]